MFFVFYLFILLDAVDGTKESKGMNKVQNSIRIMKEKISLLSKRGKKLVKKEKKLKSNLEKFKGVHMSNSAVAEFIFLPWACFTIQLG